MSRDSVVVGGLATGYALASAGHTVRLLERAQQFADAVTGRELVHLDLGDAFRERYPAPYVVAHRSDVHRILLDACRRAGVKLLTGRTVERVETGGCLGAHALRRRRGG